VAARLDETGKRGQQDRVDDRQALPAQEGVEVQVDITVLAVQHDGAERREDDAAPRRNGSNPAESLGEVHELPPRR
jgi:hypothetical protein